MFIELQTKRLVIKKPQIKDKKKLITELNNWEVVKWLTKVPFPYSDKDADNWINFLTVDNLQFNIFLSNNLIGGVGLRKNEHLIDELGYWLGEKYWGNGYIPEVCSELLNYINKELKINKIQAGYIVGNVRSAKVLEKLGFNEIGKGSIFSLSRQEQMQDIKLELKKI